MHGSSNLFESRKCFLEHFRNNYLINALYDAIIDADLSTVKFLLECKNVNPNSLIPEFDAAPLHAAPGIGTQESALISVNMLLNHGANPNIATSDGTTPLMISCLWGREHIVKLLLDRGANPFLEDVEGNNSFHYALESDNISVYNFIIEYQNNISCGIEDTVTYVSPDEREHLNIYEPEENFNTVNEMVEFSDIDSDAKVIGIYSLNTGFRNLTSVCDMINEDNALSCNDGMFLFSDSLNCAINPPNQLQNFITNGEEQSEVDSFVTAKNSSTNTSIISYATDHLKQELKRNKIMYGPVTQTTKRVYQKLLTKVIKGKKCAPIEDEFSHYPEILRNTFTERFDTINKWYSLEKLMTKNFSDAKKLWRGGKEKQFFTYLLLDPFITNNIPIKKNEMKEVDAWKTFILSIFYVGKGKNSRPFSHLYEALKTMNKKTLSKKVKRIQTIWDKSAGVICLHIFHNVVSAEAHTREAAMIDAIGSSNLTNIQSGEYYGVVKNWSIKQKQQLGIVLLYKALQIYYAEGERQIFATDLT